MTPQQVQALLGYASAIDPRIRRNDPGERQLQVAAWHAQLQHTDPADARAAVDAHYARPTPEPPMPGDIRSLSIARANERAERHAPASTLAIEGRPLRPRPQFDLAAASAAIAARWAAPLATNPPPPRSDRRPRQPIRHTETDADRARHGRPKTICFRCADSIPAPPGWDPTDPASPPTYCGPCQTTLEEATT